MEIPAQADGLATLEFAPRANKRTNFCGGCLDFGEAQREREISAQRLAHQLRTSPMFGFSSRFDLLHHFARERNSQNFTGSHGNI